MSRLTLHRFNNILSIVVVMLCLYVVIAPFWPQVTYKIQKEPPLIAAEKSGQEKIPEQNTLVIGSIKFAQLIHESADQSALNKGIWHHPQSGTPGQGKNTVLIGHRFTYAGPAVFYHLDKVKKGDRVIVYWDRQKYQYEVSDILVVSPTNGEVEKADVGEERLTIYTCTPLWSAKNRLVIQAKPIGENP